MSDVIVNLIELNENIDYSAFMTAFCSYLIALWLVISIWVGVDAYRRFNNKTVAFTFFLLTFLLNFPILIFYFIVRPEFKYEDFEEWETGGVNVPIVNFRGKDGSVSMVLELKINPIKIASEQSDMKIDVSWESNKEQFALSTSGQDSKNVQQGEIPKRADRKIVTTFRNLGGLVSKRIERFKEISVTYVKTKRKNKVEKQDVKKQSVEEQKNKSKSSKKRSKRRKK